MNRGFRTPMSSPTLSRWGSWAGAVSLRRRSVALLAAVVFAACALAQSAPAWGADASIAPQSSTEGNAGPAPVNVTISLNAPAGVGGETVDVETLATGTATPGADFTTFLPTTVTFDEGAITATIPLTIVGDAVYENDQTVVLRLSNPGIGTTVNASDGTVTISNDDAKPTLSISSETGNEGAVVTFTVTRNGATELTAGATYNVDDVTATAGTDYTDTSGSVSIAPSNTSAIDTFSVTTLNDNIYEGNESFSATLTGASNASITTPTGTATIDDSADLPSISISGGTVTEDGGSQPAFTVTRTGGTAVDTVATIDTGVPATATASTDYTAIVAGTVTIPFTDLDGQVTVPVGILNDGAVFEGNETFSATLSEPVAASIGSATATATITDAADVPTIVINDASVAEGAVAGFTVSLSNPSTQPVTVRYNTVNGTAVAPDDYTAIPLSPTTFVTFPALSNANQPIRVTTVGDTVDELDETFQVALNDPTGGATIGDGTGTGTILDDDTASISISDVTVTEGNSGLTPATNATFNVTVSTTSDRPISVTTTTGNGTATAPADYTARTDTTDTVTFPANTSAPQPFTVAVRGDLLDEDAEATATPLAAETFNVTLSNPTNNATITDGAAVGTITDDDATPTLSINNIPVNPEGTAATPTAAAFTVTLSAPSGLGVSVNFATADGSAVSVATPTSPIDYTAATGSASIAAGLTTTTIPISINADNVDELSTETFKTALSRPTNATIPPGLTGTATITDDDNPPVISINDITVAEGNTGPVVGSFTVSLSNPSFRSISVTYASADGTATAPADYTALPPTVLDFPPLSTNKPVNVTAIGDALDEADLDTAFINLSLPMPSAGGTLGDPQGQLNIADDDALPFVTFQVPSTELQTEGDSGAPFKDIVIQLTGVNGAQIPSGRNVTVRWNTADIPDFAPNGTPNVDYGSVASTQVTFAPGDLTKTLRVSIIGDLIVEGSESVGVVLTTPVNADPLLPGPKQIVILDNDHTNQPPFANGDAVTVSRNTPGTVNVRSNDIDPDNDVTIVTGNTPPAHGMASCQPNGVCLYTPTPGYIGPDAFSYTLSDFVATGTGTVNITVTNATPIANPDVLVTGQGVPGSVNVLTNDTDPDGGTLSVASAANGAHGTVACGAGTCNYIPAGGFIGADQFTYTLKDNDGATAVGTVSVTVAKGKPLTITASANGAKSRKGAKNGYTITIRNPNPGPVTLTSVSVCIPRGFSYTAGSVAGPLKKIPAKGACGAGKAKLTWAKKVSVPAKRFVTLRFKVNVGGALTTATVTVTAKAADSFAVIPLTKPAAPIKVTAPLSHGAK